MGIVCQPHTQPPPLCASYKDSHRHCVPATNTATGIVWQPHTQPPALCASHAQHLIGVGTSVDVQKKNLRKHCPAFYSHTATQPPALCATHNHNHRHCVLATHKATGIVCQPRTQQPALCASHTHSYQHRVLISTTATGIVRQPHTQPPALCASHTQSHRHCVPAMRAATGTVCQLHTLPPALCAASTQPPALCASHKYTNRRCLQATTKAKGIMCLPHTHSFCYCVPEPTNSQVHSRVLQSNSPPAQPVRTQDRKSMHQRQLPQRVCHSQQCARLGRHVLASEQAQDCTAPLKN